MHRLITRLRKGSRTALAPALATVVALPLGATAVLGLASAPAQAAAPEPAPQTQETDAGAGAGATSEVDIADVLDSVPLSKAVPWTADENDVARADESFDALLFSKTQAFRHANIPTAITAIQQLGTQNGFNVTSTEDAGVFTDANLAQYEVVIFLSTTGDVLNDTQQGAFERYIQAGGGYAGIHAASDTEYNWPWYGNLVGSYFNNHPAGTPTATVKVEDPAHPSTAGIEPRWQRTDEWYNFRTNPRGKVHVLASMDETTYTPGNGSMGAEHPIAWCQDYDGGRSWYTGMGHTDASFADAKFLGHILGGIKTAAGVLPSDCTATLEPSFEKVALDENTSNPMELDIADDGRVFYVDRNGAVRIIKPNGSVVTAGTVPVYTGQEFGMLGLALDPNFATNNYIYLYYSPQGSVATDRVARYTMSGDTMPLTTATTIIDIPTQRDQCCHAGGAIEFDKDGNLYIATGDNTNPFDSGGYTPIDERSGRSAWDAQRTSANTNSLNGKVLKIKPLAAGGYSIPAGNLFDEAADTQQKTRPEIYAMGFRNPFRIGLDEQNNKLLVADYGPDAGSVSATRGPNGRVEWNILDQPGNYGWPYCVGNNTPYNDYNFASSTAGATFNCAAPVNDSPNNTGLTNLPPAKPAVIWQSNNASITGTPEIGASGAPMTSGTYDFDPNLASDRKWPAYFDSKAVWADWNNNRLFTVQMNQAGTNYTDINRFLPNLRMSRPHALQFGPDGALYMIEWGSGFNGNNTDSGIYRIDYVEGNRAPIARATANRTSGPAPLAVTFDGTASFDPDTGDATGITYAWDFTSDGTVDATTPTASFTYQNAGNYTARLTVTDAGGRTGTTNIDIVAGNTAPTVKITTPLNGGFFEFGDYVRYTVTVTDPEDGTIDCNKVIVQPALGHDEHSHGYEQYRGCSGVVPIPGDAGHVGANIFGVLTASYTDGGSGAAGALTGVDGVVLHTNKKEAEFFDETGRTGSTTGGTAGVATQTTTDTDGGLNVTGVETGDWFGWDVMNLTNINGITMRVASTTAGAAFEVRQGSPTGTAIATVAVPNTGGAQTWQSVTVPFTNPALTSQPLYVVATTGGANVNWLSFNGRGITDNKPPVVSITGTPLRGEAPLPVQFASTVSDPENDTPLTYAWTFGDGTTATTANPTHTYAAPGKYVASLVVTDARGAKTTQTTEINVTRAADTCFNGRSDDFVGAELDTTRWNRTVRLDQGLTVADGTLNIPLTNTDIYQGTNTTPNIVLQDLPSGAFEVTTKVTVPAVRGYQQGGLIIYGDDNNYLKLVYSGRSTAAAGSKAANVIQFAKEVNATASETNSTALGATFPDTVWLRMTSTDGNVVTPSYSTDGATFVPITTSSGTAAPRDLTSITAPKVGLLGLGSTAAGAADNIQAKFDYFTITPDNTATPCSSGNTCLDTFDGNALGSTWEVVRPSGNITVGGGNLTIPMAGTDLYQTTNTAGDLVLRDLPDGPFQLVTKVTAPINRQYQQAGLIIYGDDNNYIKLVAQGRSSTVNAANNIIQLTKELNATATESNTAALGASFPSTVWLRLNSADGTAITGEYSTDGETWTAMPRGFDLTGFTNPRVGLTAFANNAAAATISAQFDSFELISDSCGGEEPSCFVENFDGNALTAGWGLVRPSGNLVVSGGTVKIPLEATDLYQTTNTARDLVLRELPDGPFVATTKVSAPINRSYQSAGLLIYGDDDNYLKHVFQGRSDQPNAASNIIQTARETTGTAVETNTAGLGDTFPTTVWLRVSSTDGNTVLGSYSTDGVTWTDMSGGYDIGDLTNPRIGLLAAANTAGGAGITASFDWFTLGGDADCEPGGGEPTDTTAPTTTLTIPTATGTAGWYTTRPSFTLAATDNAGGSGLGTTEYRIAGGAWTPYTTAVSVTGEGERLIEFRSTDKAGNVETIKSQTVKIDTVVPTVSGAVTGTTAKTLTLSATDATSGVARIEYQVGDATTWTAYTTALSYSTPGTYVVRYRSVDNAGNTSAVGTSTVVVDQPAPADTTAPTTAITIAAPTGQADWYTTRPSFTLAATDNAGGSGVASTEYRIAGGAWTPYTTAVSVTGEGERLIEFRSTDVAGNVEVVKSRTVKIDTVVPTVSGAVTGTTTKTLTLTATDATSGVARIEYQVGDATTWTAYTAALSYSTPGTYVVRYRSVDNAGNTSAVGTSTVVVDQPAPADTTAPTTVITIAAPTGQSEWYTSAPSFTLAATDNTGGSGVASTEYRIAGGAWMPYTTAVTVTGEDVRLIEFRSTDVAGNVEATKSRSVKVDTVVPTVNGVVSGEDVMSLTLTATDATSGVARIEYKIGDAADWTAYTAPVQLDQPGTYVVSYRSVDNAGNTSAVGTSTVVVEEEPTAPSVALTVNPEEPDGRNGWYTSAVTVTLTGAGGEGDLSLEYRIGDGAWTAYTAPFQVDQDGTNRVQARATDGSGTVSEVVTSTFRIDATAPRLTVAGIANGAKLNLAAVRTARVTTTDATSGIASRVIRLDGKVVLSPAKLDAMLLRTGTHRLVVTVTDKAGNTTSRTITFRVVATYAGAKQLVNRLDKENKIGTPLGKQLKQQLNAAQKADKQGKAGQARQALNAFSNLAKGVRNAQAKSALTDAARQLKAQL